MMHLVSIVFMGEKFKAASFQSWRILQNAGTVVLLALWLLLAGCGSVAQPEQPVSASIAVTPAEWSALFYDYPTDEAAVTALILAERQAAIDHNLALLGELWGEDAHVIDGRGNATPSDDYVWQGRAAILDRYVVAVFPFALPPLTALDAAATLTITGEQAMIQNGNDHWQLVKVNERWWLTELHYDYQTPR
jgi:hypothetical protein